jgi:cytochrome c
MRTVLVALFVLVVATASTAAQDGAALFQQRACLVCHSIGVDPQQRIGPHLNGVVGRPIASVDGYSYSRVMENAGNAGAVWDRQTLLRFLKNPRHTFPGTKMNYAGIKSRADIEAIIDYLDDFNLEGGSAGW